MLQWFPSGPARVKAALGYGGGAAPVGYLEDLAEQDAGLPQDALVVGVAANLTSCPKRCPAQRSAILSRPEASRAQGTGPLGPAPRLARWGKGGGKAVD